MTQLLHSRASTLLAIEDEYIAWCLDEAVASITASLRAGRKRRPKAAPDNRELINRITGGETHGD